jgi:D-alanyl-D-alanine carboxypeptidase/D-alanyl-D-alanine-endopeptidase (penicillin-binding protein 4)
MVTVARTAGIDDRSRKARRGFGMSSRLHWLLVLGLSIAGPVAFAAEPLEARVGAVLKSRGYQNGHWGLLIVDAKSGKTVYEKNADEMFCPASVTKLFTTAAAIADFGADYRFRTPVVRRGDVDAEGVLHGDLILVAQGDLCLGGRTGPDGSLLFEDNDHTYSGGNPNASLVSADPLAGLDHLAREVRAAGVREVAGDVLVDDRLFEPAESTGSGPSRLSPVVVNDNVVDVVATPAPKAGEPASVKIVPETSFVSMDAQVETVAEGGRATLTVRAAGPRRFSVRGRVPVGHKPVVKIYEVEEPAAFARTLLIERLRARGVRVSASAIGENAADRLPPRGEVGRLPKAAEYTSPPLREYVRVILKVSHNLHASTLPLLIAAHHGERTLGDGLKREGFLLKGLGVDVTTIAFGGGAGGARADLVTPRATVALLRAMAGRPDFAAYEAGLPVLGRDGTLAKAVDTESPARGHARAKTGTYWVDNGLDGKAILTSKALAGYMETASGRPLVFAFFVNEVPLDVSGRRVSDATTAAGRLLGELCEVFYSSDADSDSKSGNGREPARAAAP